MSQHPRDRMRWLASFCAFFSLMCLKHVLESSHVSSVPTVPCNEKNLCCIVSQTVLSYYVQYFVISLHEKWEMQLCHKKYTKLFSTSPSHTALEFLFSFFDNHIHRHCQPPATNCHFCCHHYSHQFKIYHRQISHTQHSHHSHHLSDSFVLSINQNEPPPKAPTVLEWDLLRLIFAS